VVGFPRQGSYVSTVRWSPHTDTACPVQINTRISRPSRRKNNHAFRRGTELEASPRAHDSCAGSSITRKLPWSARAPCAAHIEVVGTSRSPSADVCAQARKPLRESVRRHVPAVSDRIVTIPAPGKPRDEVSSRRAARRSRPRLRDTSTRSAVPSKSGAASDGKSARSCESVGVNKKRVLAARLSKRYPDARLGRGCFRARHARPAISAICRVPSVEGPSTPDSRRHIPGFANGPAITPASFLVGNARRQGGFQPLPSSIRGPAFPGESVGAAAYLEGADTNSRGAPKRSSSGSNVLKAMVMPPGRGKL